MAKFGIALGSGPRGLGFESRHSDQIRLKSFDFSRIFLSFQNFFRWRILHIFRLTQTRPKREFGAESAGSEKSPPAGDFPAGGTVIFRSILRKKLFFV